MAITYVGVTDFVLQSEEPAADYFELPTVSQVWKGAAPKYAAFLALTKVGNPWEGGYIIGQRGKDQGMYPEVQLTIAKAPNFLIYTITPSTSWQTSSKGRRVATTGVIPGATAVDAQIRCTFISPQRVFAYWASTMPDGPRNTAYPFTGSPQLVGNPVTVVTVSEGKADEGEPSTRTYYGNVPAPLATALALVPSGRVTAHDAMPVPGTPWYRCQDVVSYGYWGDD